MTRKDSALLKSFIVFLLLVAIGVVVTVRYQKKTETTAQASAGPTDFASISAPKKSSTAEETAVHSSKADKQLLLRVTHQKDGLSEYAYFVTDTNGTNQRVLFSKILGEGSSMSLPENSWDPTDTYVFIQQNTGSTVDFFVLKASGEPFADGAKYIDVGEVWVNKKIGYTIRTATGWASGTLLIVYTSKEDGTHGPAFWFEIPSTAILQLAS